MAMSVGLGCGANSMVTPSSEAVWLCLGSQLKLQHTQSMAVKTKIEPMFDWKACHKQGRNCTSDGLDNSDGCRERCASD